MLTRLDEMPKGVIGFEAHGKLNARDYEATLIPVVLEALDGDDSRLLFVLGDDFGGFELGEVWDDSTFGLREHFKFDKIAVVTGSSVMAGVIHSLAFLIPADVRVFRSDNREKAQSWLNTCLEA
ncbi:STAS/SEC14 domain-containing protein [Rhizobiaceae bacterium n13]|uniref:STAS/SEC14 domain-containing protein n=1 Tax=Ferirhizobium litorale TaxID=2927786 RepID=A0AAE3TZH0_9HYPH|nr:STAS/SEC14 domain-containing protein [Fererhizobium litorale]MDI7860831.1 STAS/SEC14 domain-containing protein [Fererhizobium litorale]MDI7920979.1 STAS/SEC14 domain-containing protein [Fererhizobium litorale]